MSRVNDIKLDMTLTPKTVKDYQDIDANYNYTFTLYSHNYNILRIVGGMGDIEFAN